VVVSDARGNVPLAASRAGRLENPVFREGIDDALEAARGLRTLNSLEIYFLNTQPQQYPELPAMLAEALGAAVENVPLEESF
jgi:magnesium chelatase subunit D